MSKTATELIARANDEFRSRLGLPSLETNRIRGRSVTTRGVASLEPEDQISILAKVRNFCTFSLDNDPLGEHDFGSIDHNGDLIFWKIDYYTPDLCDGSADPADLAQTERVLTIMLASEY